MTSIKIRLKNTTCFIIAILAIVTINAQSPLTTEEKLEDFDYFYEAFKLSYPYFGVNKRLHNIDWLSKKATYRQQIAATKNDTTFFKAIHTMFSDLNNGHTDAYPTIIYNYFYDAYQYGASQDSTYNIYVKELEKTSVERSKHWEGINRQLFFPEDSDSNDGVSTETIPTPVTPNVTFEFSDHHTTALLHVKSFSYDYVEQDADTLKFFFNKAQHYKNLIIDIQGNDGGSTEYWLNNMIPHLIDQPISYPITIGFKNSKRLRAFKPGYFKNTMSYDAIKLPNMPDELTDGSYLFRKDIVTIDPASSTTNRYKGKIYLLVDEAVFSSAEALAYFCKATHFAVVAGKKTSGDGVGSDPLIMTLPHSGIVLRFTGEMGLNPDGSANDETKTIPDLKLNASTILERREALYKHIKTNNN
jgi:C-terminal processing protease CtpA/Prc